MTHSLARVFEIEASKAIECGVSCLVVGDSIFRYRISNRAIGEETYRVVAAATTVIELFSDVIGRIHAGVRLIERPNRSVVAAQSFEA